MKLHIKLGLGSGSIRDKNDDIIGVIGWQPKEGTYVVMAKNIPAIYKLKADGPAHLQTVIHQAVGTRPTIEVFATRTECVREDIFAFKNLTQPHDLMSSKTKYPDEV